MNANTLNRCVEIARDFGVTKLILFGSVLASPEKARDVDIACKGVGGWDLYRFGARLSEEFGSPVDVVPLQDNDRFSQLIVK